jgi:bacterioferritin-associated ferredoxin
VYVCQCKAVTDRTVSALVAAGCHDVDTIGDVCGAGTDCGGCVDTLEEIVERVTRETRVLVGQTVG